MLGYVDAVCAITNARFGAAETDVPILMDNLLCTGSEQALDQCGFSGWLNNDCTHREDAGVICVDGKNDFNRNKLLILSFDLKCLYYIVAKACEQSVYAFIIIKMVEVGVIINES